MRQHVHDHAQLAFALPIGDMVGLKGKVRDEVRQD